jgi:hypothetical protein
MYLFLFYFILLKLQKKIWGFLREGNILIGFSGGLGTNLETTLGGFNGPLWCSKSMLAFNGLSFNVTN